MAVSAIEAIEVVSAIVVGLVIEAVLVIVAVLATEAIAAELAIAMVLATETASVIVAELAIEVVSVIAVTPAIVVASRMEVRTGSMVLPLRANRAFYRPQAILANFPRQSPCPMGPDPMGHGLCRGSAQATPWALNQARVRCQPSLAACAS